MKNITINLIAPSSPCTLSEYGQLQSNLVKYGYKIGSVATFEKTSPSFLSKPKEQRIKELVEAERESADALWAVRGGVGALELFGDYSLPSKQKPLIGFSDITLLHLHRFLKDKRIGIHGANALNTINDDFYPEILDSLILGEHQKITYPKITKIAGNDQDYCGPLIVMNLSSLQTALGCLDFSTMSGVILALEDNNVKHYQVWRMLVQLEQAGVMDKVTAIICGHFQYHRSEILLQTLVPLTQRNRIGLFDFPYFGHDNPNMPLLFGKKTLLKKQKYHEYSLEYVV